MSLAAHGISVRYDGRPIIEDLSIGIEPGQVVGLCGPSGVGKTTLARALTGLVGVDDGCVSVDGRPIENRRGRMTGDVTMLFQSPRRSCSPRQTLGQLISEPLRGKLGTDGVRAHTAALCQEVGLTPDLIGRLPAAVSDGQLQKAALARALATDPAYLICDEATSMLDALTTASVIGVLQRRVAGGLGVLAISHDRELLTVWADLVLELASDGPSLRPTLTPSCTPGPSRRP